jgi:hypothetical protein
MRSWYEQNFHCGLDALRTVVVVRFVVGVRRARVVVLLRAFVVVTLAAGATRLATA